MTGHSDAEYVALQCANAALQERLDAALTQRDSNYGERAAHQAATIDVLRAMSASPGDPQPVFEMIVERARDLCDGYGASIWEFDGTLIHLRAATGISDDPSVRQAMESLYPMLPNNEFPAGRVILNRQVTRIDDFDTEPGLSVLVRDITAKSSVQIPFMRGDVVIGALGLGSRERGGFSDSQIELLKTFAEQAVIAITSAETYRALRTRTADLQESLEYQTATSDVLKVISRSTFDLDPVLAAVAETAARLCDSDQAMISRYEDGMMWLGANFGFPPEYEARVRSQGRMPVSDDNLTVSARAYREGRVVHIEDVAAVPGYSRVAIDLGKQRTSLGVPLLRDGQTIGCIVLARQRVEPFTERQIELVRTFADQAVIAIENTRLMTEQREALEQQTATAEVVQAINASQGDLAPVFQTMLDRGLQLCGAAFGELTRMDGDVSTTVAVSGMPAAFSRVRVGSSARHGLGTIGWRLRHGEKFVHVTDLVDTDLYRDGDPVRRALVDDGGARALLVVPLRKDDALIGMIAINRQEPGAFTSKQIALLENFAAQAVIAMENARLLGELRDRTAELAERNDAFAERIEHQAATIDVLKAMSASPGDPRPVFDQIVSRAAALCNANAAALFEFDGELVRFSAFHSDWPTDTEAYAAYVAAFPMAPSRGSISCRAILDRALVHVRDTDLDTELASAVRGILQGRQRSQISIPLLRDGRAIGAVSLGAAEPGGFSDSQIDLLKTFAEQAVIAITSAETYRALQTRTADLQESLHYQTAISDVLSIISRSTADAQPVLDKLVETAARLCDAEMAMITRCDDKVMWLGANHGYPTELWAHWMAQGPFPLDPTSVTVGMRTVTEGRVVHVHDVSAVPDYPVPHIALGGLRTILGVPLRNNDRTVGHIGLARARVEPFTARQVALLENFAAQAVIAIENARLLTEQREALEQQTATAEVLQVINASPGDLAPVFQTMLDRALQLCGAAFGELVTDDGDVSTTVAVSGMPAAFSRIRVGNQARQGPGTTPWRLRHGENLVHVTDLVDTDLYRDGDPARRALVDDGGARALLAVPLRKDDALIGMIGIFRQEPGAFTDKQIALLQNFAAQAVIAMENARLLTETREALEQQTATAEVLQVINASPGDLAPVFDAILNKAHTLCGAAIGSLYTWDGESVRAVATHGFPDDYAAFARQSHPPNFMIRPLIDGERYHHVPDVRALEPTRDKHASSIMEQTDARTILMVPLRKDGVFAGFITAVRTEVRPFVEKEIALLENFAAQAVIAMENARLLTETRDALEQQTATAEVLQVINASPGDLAPVFDAILERAHRICRFDHGALALFDGTHFRSVATRGCGDTGDAVTRVPYLPSGAQRLVLRGARYGHIPDVSAFDAEPDDTVFTDWIALSGFRATLLVPLRKDGAVIGHLSGWRFEAGPFSDKEITLLENFAAQAVIAMENARLLTETREALEQQTATAELLRTINESPGNTQPVFDAMLEKAMLLCGIAFGLLVTWDGKVRTVVAVRGLPPAVREYTTSRMASTPSPGILRLLESRRPHQILDLMDDDGYRNGHPDSRMIVDIGGVRTCLNIPLIKDDTVVGMFSFYRRDVREFSGKEIALLENFAEQAVIAMENARLLTEQREALERQTATAEVLQVINTSPGNLAPVFDSILEKARKICRVDHGSLVTFDGTSFHSMARQGYGDQGDAIVQAPRSPQSTEKALLAGARFAHVPDLSAYTFDSDDAPFRAFVDATGFRALLDVPLRKDDILLGYIAVWRKEAGSFLEREIALLENFAAQAVIAMDNARLLNEQREALEQQTATAEVLQTINASPGNLAPVFDAMLEKAMRLCGVAFGSFHTWDGEATRFVAMRGFPPEIEAYVTARGPSRAPGPWVSTMAENRRPFQYDDLRTSEAYLAGQPDVRAFADLGGVRTGLVVPLVKDQTLIGYVVVYRLEVRPFSGKEIALLENFAAQAVIAMENARLLTETREALEQQTATAEVLGVINASPGNLVPVLDALLDKALRLSGAAFGMLNTFDGTRFHRAAHRGIPPEYLAYIQQNPDLLTENLPQWVSMVLDSRRAVQLADLREDESYLSGHPLMRPLSDIAGTRSILAVPLVRDNATVGIISVFRQDVRPFTDKQVALIENFAAQAVIAMENARLLTEQREALERQTAMADVLRTINENPGDLAPVFDAIMERSLRLGGAAFGALYTYDGERFHMAAIKGVPPEFEEHRRRRPQPIGADSPPGQLLATRRPVQVVDNMTHPFFVANPDERDAQIRLGGVRAILALPLLNDGAVVGQLVIYRKDPGTFPDKQVALLENFAAQAVIAMDNARLLNEIRQRQSELDITFENMGDGVAMFDGEQRLAAWNRNFQDILDLPDDAVRVGLPFADYIRGLAAKGEYGPDADADEQIARLTALLDQANRFERTRPNGRVIDIRQNPIPGGGFVVIYADITERKRAEEALRAARDAAEQALRDLKLAQANLVQAEKMASLGQLTAGIAHEIKNPLNFVNNFASLSVDLLAELRESAAPALATLTEDQRVEIDEVSDMLTSNLQKITEHGRRADGIVKAMLEHSRGASGERREVDINTLAEEALNLAYHGARAQDQDFNIALERDFGGEIASIELNPQDITRVLLNLFGNGFYAAHKRARDGAGPEFSPTLKVATRDLGRAVEIRVRDNGTGIPEDIRDKLFQPFFTTKPTGEGTGLGLSISYDIVTKQHGGTISVDSAPGRFTEFTVTLPRGNHA